MEHEPTQQPTIVNPVIESYLQITTAWRRWMDRALERGDRRPLRIDNEGLELEDGNDFA